MKKAFITSLLLLLGITAYAQHDTMYVMKNGMVTHIIPVKPEDVDSIVFYKPEDLPMGTFVDARDNKTYNYVNIGTQVWMAENLAYLPEVNTVTDGSEDNSAGKFYYVYDFTPDQDDPEQTQVNLAKATPYYQTYGALYNWNAALNACPAGWHLPSDAEWTVLTDYLGGTIAGGKLKETGTSHWASPNTGATNESYFFARPGGYRWNGEAFALISSNGEWWSSTENASNTAFRRSLSNSSSNVQQTDFLKDVGFSVRCVKD